MKIYKLSMYQNVVKAAASLIIFLALCFTGHVFADETLNVPSSIDNVFDNWIRATDDELAQQRGGFVLPNGMTIDISLERTVLLNGVETISFLSQFSENGFLLQNGSKNIAPDSIGSALSFVVQNNFDDQTIKTINEIDLEIGGLQNMEFNPHHDTMHSISPMLQ